MGPFFSTPERKNAVHNDKHESEERRRPMPANNAPQYQGRRHESEEHHRPMPANDDPHYRGKRHDSEEHHRPMPANNDPPYPIRRHEPEERHRPMPANDAPQYQGRRHEHEPTIEDEMNDAFFREAGAIETISLGIPFDRIVGKYSKPLPVEKMERNQNRNSFFMINPLRDDSSHPDRMPEAIHVAQGYSDQWDENHVRMPCSPQHKARNNHPIWNETCRWLAYLKEKCDTRVATLTDLKKGIASFGTCNNNMECLDTLIETTYSNEDRTRFMYKTLSGMCDLVLNLPSICTEPPPLLRSGSNQSVTMSQLQAASLLACAFFCLFPNRSERGRGSESERYPNPNFDRLYQGKSPEKIEKLKCLLHYFRRVTEKMPTGVITIQRSVLPKNNFPAWHKSKATISDLHLTTGKKIEDIPNVLQVDFANKYIGGGVLGNGCVQEEIRFSICPEMLVSLLVCEVMEPNECIFLIGCERYSLYKGYADSFQFDGDLKDYTLKDDWGRKWSHLVAMDAIFFRDKTAQYNIKSVERELIKAYTSFRPADNESEYGIATGNWGCGAFNGDRQLKAIIQLMAASEARRPLIYAAFGDKKLVNSFFEVYDYLRKQGATVADLYLYLQRYADRYTQMPLFDYILRKPISALRS